MHIYRSRQLSAAVLVVEVVVDRSDSFAAAAQQVIEVVYRLQLRSWTLRKRNDAFCEYSLAFAQPSLRLTASGSGACSIPV